MERDAVKNLGNRVGIAALALLLPGGLIIGGALAYREYRKRQAADAPAPSDPKP